MQYWSNGKKLFVDNPASKVKIPSRFVALIDRSLAASTFVEFENQMRDESFTLTHGGALDDDDDGDNDDDD